MKDMAYELNDYVEFKDKGKDIIGYVAIKDFNGGGICEGIMHSYDIYSEIEDILIKHVPESELFLLAKADSLACEALKLAINKHEDQVDLANKPYINHIVTVGKNTLEVSNDDKTLAVAFLHDILEDTDVSEKELFEIFPDEVVYAVKAITKDSKNISYDEYLKKVKENEMARIVKLADLKHNSMLSRLKTYNRTDLLRVKKYKDAIEYLYS
ncbi:HD domain-containing protein [Enterococcus entomosocium]|uniref:HD domain-containing protein n=1 Tax=Enterococcus entomosocium TaxID=3034352 RepID=UPI003BD3A84B